MTITLTGNPISVNALYRGRRFLTRDGAEAKRAAAWEAKTQLPAGFGPTKEEVRVRIRFHFRNDRSDIDNALKSVLDSMTGILWDDDRQIVYLEAHKSVDRANPRVEIEIIE